MGINVLLTFCTFQTPTDISCSMISWWFYFFISLFFCGGRGWDCGRGRTFFLFSSKAGNNILNRCTCNVGRFVVFSRGKVRPRGTFQWIKQALLMCWSVENFNTPSQTYEDWGVGGGNCANALPLSAPLFEDKCLASINHFWCFAFHDILMKLSKTILKPF